MAWYDVTYACGHKGQVQLYGKEKDRVWKLEEESRKLCPDCYKAKVQKERAEMTAKAQEVAKGKGLPELTGSEKQVAWAYTIRQKFIDYKDSQLVNDIGGIINDLDYIWYEEIQDMGRKDPSLVNRFIEYVRFWKSDILENTTQANVWIDNKDDVENLVLDKVRMEFESNPIEFKAKIAIVLGSNVPLSVDIIKVKDNSKMEITDLPKLKGSEQQIKYANDIRQNFIDYNDVRIAQEIYQMIKSKDFHLTMFRDYIGREVDLINGLMRYAQSLKIDKLMTITDTDTWINYKSKIQRWILDKVEQEYNNHPEDFKSMVLKFMNNETKPTVEVIEIKENPKVEVIREIKEPIKSIEPVAENVEQLKPNVTVEHKEEKSNVTIEPVTRGKNDNSVCLKDRIIKDTDIVGSTSVGKKEEVEEVSVAPVVEQLKPNVTVEHKSSNNQIDNSKKTPKGRIPKKPEDERLSAHVSAATTQNLKADVKAEAEEKDESVSEFVRNSVKDEVYADLHSKGNLPELEVDHDKTKDKAKELLSQSSVVSKGSREPNTVSGKTLYDLLVSMDYPPFLRLKFSKINLQIIFFSDGLAEIVTLKDYYGDIDAMININDIYKTIGAIMHASNVSFKLNDDKIDVFIENSFLVTLKIESEKYAIEYEKNMVRFSTLKEWKTVNEISMTSKDLYSILRTTEYAMEDDPDKKLDYKGIEIDSTEYYVKFIASDYVKIGYVQYPQSDNIDKKHFIDQYSFLLYHGVDFLLKVLRTNKSKVSIVIGMNKVAIMIKDETMDIEVTQDYPNHKFIDYKQIIDEVVNPVDKPLGIVFVDAKALYDGVKSLSPYYKKHPAVIFEISKGQLTKSGESKIVLRAEDNKEEVKVGMEFMDVNEDIKIAYDPTFVMEALRLWYSNGYQVNSEHKVSLEFISTSMLVIKPLKSENAMSLIMPIKLRLRG